MKKKLELYAATSQIFGDKAAGFGNSSEYLVGMNFYPVDTRNHRLNVQVIDVNRSPVSSAFGYYIGGRTADVVLDGVLGVLLKGMRYRYEQITGAGLSIAAWRCWHCARVGCALALAGRRRPQAGPGTTRFTTRTST